MYTESTVRKLGITYKMLRGKNEAAETFVELPISKERYTQLYNMVEGSEAWEDIRQALVALTQLQGYDKLGAWSLELEVITKDDKE